MKFKIPSISDILLYGILSLLVTIVFSVIYFKTNHHASTVETIGYFLEIEKSIPFIPAFIIIYFSLNLLMTAPLFFFSKKEVITYGIELILGTMIAGVIFYFFPGELGFTRVVPEGMFKEIYQSLFAIDAPHNLAPSLHIFFSYMTILNLVRISGSKLWHIWGGLMCLAVLFTHQHHLLDILLGFLLAYVLYFIKERIRKVRLR